MKHNKKEDKKVFVAKLYATNPKYENAKENILGYFTTQEKAIFAIYKVLESEQNEFQFNFELNYEFKTSEYGNKMIVSYLDKKTKELTEKRTYSVDTIRLDYRSGNTSTFWF